MSKTVLFLSFILLVNCGFKVQDKSEFNNFSIKEIISSGDKRANFKIKNNLTSSVSKDNQKMLIINLDTKKNKKIKEKNIKNEITKYEVTLIVKITFNSINDDKVKKFNLSITGDYLVGKNYSSTLNNEKKLIDNLVDRLSENIINGISLQLNDI